MAIIKKIKQYNPSSSFWDEYDLGAMAENITFSSNVGLQDLFVQTDNGPVLSSSYGGTGLTSISNRIIDLGSSVGGNPLTQNIGVSGILPIANGGAGFKDGSQSYWGYIKTFNNTYSSTGNPAASILNTLDFVVDTTSANSTHMMYDPVKKVQSAHASKRLHYYQFWRWGKVVQFMIQWQFNYKPSGASSYWNAVCGNNINNCSLGIIKNPLFYPSLSVFFTGDCDDTNIPPILSINSTGGVFIRGYHVHTNGSTALAKAFNPSNSGPGTAGLFKVSGMYIAKN